jgi:hypothetical protein
MLRALFLSDFFRSRTAHHTMANSPADYLMGLLRLSQDFSFPKPGIYDVAFECRYMGQDLLNPPSVEGWHTRQEWIDTGILVERVNFAASVITDFGKPGVRKIVDMRAAGELEPEAFLDACLGTLGPLPIRPWTRAALLNHVNKQGPRLFDDDDTAAAERVTEVLQLIVAARELQFM